MSNINLVNINKNYRDVAALKNVNLTFERNKIYGLLGRNGAGKTTLLNILSNRIFPTSGQVVIDDKNINDIPKQISNIYLSGESNLLPESMKVKEIFKWTKEFIPSFDGELALRLAQAFELPIKKRVQSLSTGYLTILKDILALCANTEFVFFDEPVLGLDANHREMFYKFLLECYVNNDSTYVVSTHHIDEVANIIENIIIINEGSIIRDTTCESLLSEGYTISGKIEDVDKYIADKNVIGFDTLANTKSAYILSAEKITELPESLQVSRINLQKLFIELTKKEASK
ncbi:MAG: ABC transporter ATP-binding protein [Clostridia bacterium]|nr:ABC transporter ATP-binding protein [Clostridia bacterium]